MKLSKGLCPFVTLQLVQTGLSWFEPILYHSICHPLAGSNRIILVRTNTISQYFSPSSWFKPDYLGSNQYQGVCSHFGIVCKLKVQLSFCEWLKSLGERHGMFGRGFYSCRHRNYKVVAIVLRMANFQRGPPFLYVSWVVSVNFFLTTITCKYRTN